MTRLWLAALVLLLATVGWAGRRELGFALDSRSDDTCVGCHAERHAGIVADWHGSGHFQAGVGCEGCHGTAHEAIVQARGVVAAAVCAECHAAAVEVFAASVHGRGPAAMERTSLFLGAPEAVREAGCRGCHPIPDGGACEGCHGGHRFEASVARRPETCAGCHDGPETAAWRASAHGRQYTLFGEEAAPACAACHLDGHTDVPLLTLGRGRQGAVLEGEPAVPPQAPIPRSVFEAGRAAAVARCTRCHARDQAERALAGADAVKREADRPLAEAAELVRRLAADGLLRPMPEDRRPDPVAGHTLAPGESYTDLSAPEQRHFELARAAHPAAVRGAYHFAPGVLHGEGWAALQAGLTHLREETRRLRDAPRPVVAPIVREAEP